MKTILIKTRLHDGINKSSGGGQTNTHYTFNMGPLNLLRAVKTLNEHYQSMERAYGSIGHQGSWIEIDDIKINRDELPSTLAEARQLIADIASGQLIRDRADFSDYMARIEIMSRAAFADGYAGEPMPHEFDEHGITPYEVKSSYQAGCDYRDDQLNEADDEDYQDLSEQNDHPDSSEQNDHDVTPQNEYKFSANYRIMLDAQKAGHKGVKLSNSGNTVIFSDNAIGNRNDLSSIPHIAEAQLRHAGLI